MTSESKTWETLKANYLRQVEKALSSVNHPRTKDIFEDVTSHLDQRFDELEPDQQTWENFQAIITEMGPASDYAELLEPAAGQQRRSVPLKYLLWIGLAAVVIIAAILLPMAIPNKKVGYIATFEPVGSFEPQTARELLDAFNENHPPGVRTHHFRTGIHGYKLQGHICVDTKAGKQAIVNMIDKSDKLVLVGVRSVTQKDLERHYALGQPSLRKKGRIVDKIDYPFVNDPEIVGRWKSVDFVKTVEDFKPGTKHWRGDLYLKEMIIFENGRTKGPWNWTKELIIHPGDKTAAKYHIKEIDGSTYMFFEWKSGDYTIRHMKPRYYVLKKIKDEDSGPAETEAELERLNRPEVRHERKLRRELQDSLEKWLKDNNETDAKKCDLLIEQIISQPRPSAEAYFTTALAAQLRGQHKKATFILRKAITECPEEHAGGLAVPVKVTGSYRIGTIARHSGNAKEATKAYENIMKNIQGVEAEEFYRAICCMYLAEIASEILKDKQLAAKQIQEAIATIDATDMDKISSDWAEVYPMLKDWALYEYARLKDGKAPVLDPSKLDKAKVGGLYGLAMTAMSLNGLEHLLLLERAAQNNKSPIDNALAKLEMAFIHMHHSNINSPEAEKYLLSLAESDSYFAPYANMILQTVREEAKKIREKIPELLNNLKYGDKEKRKWAAFKLACESGPDGVKALHQAQQDPNKYVRYEAACALARWSRDESVKPEFNLILEALTDEDEQIREKARGAFSRQSWVEIGPDEITAIVSLMNDHYSKELFWTIRQLLSSAGPEASKAAVPKLIKLLNHEDSDVRTAVLDILRRMGPAASDAIPSLIKLLPYEDETRSDYIFAIIGGMGTAAEPFMLEIAKYLDHEDINVRRAATNTLKRISPEKAEQIFKAREKEK